MILYKRFTYVHNPNGKQQEVKDLNKTILIFGL